MPSWRLHRKWAMRLGIRIDVARIVDETIDEELRDIRGRELIEKLHERGLTLDEDVVKAIILHHIMDCLRDLIQGLGRKPTKAIVEKLGSQRLVEDASAIAVERGYAMLFGPLDLWRFTKIAESLKPYSDQLVQDIIDELALKGTLRDVGTLFRVKKKFVRWYAQKVPEIKKFFPFID